MIIFYKIDDLPSEILLRICSHLGDGDLLKLPLLNHYFNNLLHDESIWRDRIKKWVYNSVIPKPQMTKAKYVEILRVWPSEIKDAKIRELPKDHDECLCQRHVYSDHNVLRCFEYITVEAAFLPIFESNIWLPLQFWFNRNPGLSLPIISIPRPIPN